MYRIGVQTKNVVTDENPAEGFNQLRQAGFTCADFSLNGYLLNTDLYRSRVNRFFDRTEQELERFFTPHKRGAEAAGITVHQMHMPYPSYLPGGSKELNEYLWNIVAPKSLKVCAFFGCKFIVVHGFKLAYYLGAEEAEWTETERFLTTLGERLKVLHIHDNDGVRDLHQIPFTFAKTRENRTSTDWEGFVSGLKTARFQGVLSFETAPVLTSFPPELRQEALGLIARIGEYFATQVLG